MIRVIRSSFYPRMLTIDLDAWEETKKQSIASVACSADDIIAIRLVAMASKTVARSGNRTSSLKATSQDRKSVV